MGKRPFFYGWVIVAITVTSMIIIYGVRHSFSVFFVVILDKFGWSRANTAIMFSLNVLIYGLLAPVAGGLADRWNPRRFMPIGCTLLALATAGCGLATKLWHFYALFGVLMPLGTVLTGWPIFAPALANWFVKRRGMATGIGLMGIGLSYSMSVPADFLISLVEWRWAYVILASMVVGVVVPLVCFFFHYEPRSMGNEPYGASEVIVGDLSQVEIRAGTAENDSMNWTFSQAVRTHRLWLLVLGFLLYWGIANYMVMAHQVAFAIDLGYSSVYAASVFGAAGISLAIGQLLGFLADRFSREGAFTLATALSIAGLLVLISVKGTSHFWMLYVFSVCFGLGTGLAAPAFIAGTADIFHGSHFGAIHGMLLMGLGVGGAIGPWLGGLIFDFTGSYLYAFIMCIIALVLACTTFWIVAPRKMRR